MHKEAFVRKAVNLLHAPQVTWKGVAQRAFEMIQSGRLILYNDYVYRPIMARAEEEVAAEICDMLKRDKMPYMGDLDDEIDRQQAELGFTFAQEQRHAIRTALTLRPSASYRETPALKDIYSAGDPEYLQEGIPRLRCGMLRPHRTRGAAHGAKYRVSGIHHP